MVEGDRLSSTITVGGGARLNVTTQAAEKIYRSLTKNCIVTNDLHIAGDGFLRWLPQETILFDGARLSRQQAVFVAKTSRFLAAEDNVESASAAGDSFPTTQVLTADGVISLAGCLMGNPFINADYIGHPG